MGCKVVSLSLPEEVIAFIEKQALEFRKSKSAIVADLFRDLMSRQPVDEKEVRDAVKLLMLSGAVHLISEVDKDSKSLSKAALEVFAGRLTTAVDKAASKLVGRFSETANSPALPSGASDPAQVDEAVDVYRRRPYQRAIGLPVDRSTQN